MRHCSAFAGVDAVGLAVRALGGETVAYSEFDPTPKKRKGKPIPGSLAAGPDGEQYNQRILAKREPKAAALGDVTKVDWKEVAQGTPFVFGSAGFPCFVAGTMVLTDRGYRPIEEIVVGDLVLTHLGRWRPVTSVMSRMASSTLVVKAQGVPEMTTTDEHPILIRRRTRGAYDKVRRVYPRLLGDEEWVDAGKIKSGSYCAQQLPVETIKRPSLGFSEKSAVLWLLGRYVADGHWSKQAIMLSVGRGKEETVEEVLVSSGLKWSKTDMRTAIRYRIASTELASLAHEFGRRAHRKTIPGWALCLSVIDSTTLIDGYLSGDGCFTDSSISWRATTVSRSLALSLALLYQRTSGLVAGVYRAPMPEKTVIEGREVNQRDQYQVRAFKKNRSGISEGDRAWKLIRSVAEAPAAEVFNISVYEDETYVADGAVVHNCQDLSAAGKGAGLDGERSGLYVEVIRMIKEARPELFLIENVPRLLGLHFERLLRDLNEIGYDCEWDVVSAAAVGDPHLRERLWIFVYKADDSLPAPRAMGKIKKISRLRITDDGVKWPRAGLMVSGQVFELDPIAPRKTKRVDGRTYWVGVNLLEQQAQQVLIPSPRATDGDKGGRGDLIQSVRGNSNGHFAQRIWDGQIIPSPVARDWKGEGMAGQLGTVAARGLWPTVHGMAAAPEGEGGGGVQGPSGNELGRAVNQGLWPSPTKKDADNARNATANRSSGSEYKNGETLSDKAYDGSLGLLPSPLAGSNRRSQKAMLASVDNGRRSGGGNSSPPGLEQAVEIIEGVVPRELDGVSMDALPVATREMLTPTALLPTPSAASYGTNQGGAAGRVGEVRHSLESMARNGLLPTPCATDYKGPNPLERPQCDDDLPTRVLRENSGLSEPRSLPSTTSSSATSSPSLRPCEPDSTEGDLLVPRFSFHEALGDGQSAELWPTPSAADGSGGPGTSPKRAGGENLRTAASEGRERGSLNPDWVEWMMSLPVGWTDIDCDEPVYRPFWDEPMPRVIKDCPNRRQRLHAIGNSLVWLVPFVLLSRYRDRVGHLPGQDPGVNMEIFS